MGYKFFYKNTFTASTDKFPGSSITMLQNKQLAEELHKPIIKKFKKRRVFCLLKDNISGPDLADMQLISKFNNRILFLYCVMVIMGYSFKR